MESLEAYVILLLLGNLKQTLLVVAMEDVI